MVQKVKQTHEEKLAMYMKLPKKKIAEMLIECNRIMELVLPKVSYGPIRKLKINDNS